MIPYQKISQYPWEELHRKMRVLCLWRLLEQVLGKALIANYFAVVWVPALILGLSWNGHSFGCDTICIVTMALTNKATRDETGRIERSERCGRGRRRFYPSRWPCGPRTHWQQKYVKCGQKAHFANDLWPNQPVNHWWILHHWSEPRYLNSFCPWDMEYTFSTAVSDRQENTVVLILLSHLKLLYSRKREILQKLHNSRFFFTHHFKLTLALRLNHKKTPSKKTVFLWSLNEKHNRILLCGRR